MPEAYYCWLIELIGDGHIELCYQKLLWKLYSTAFYYELDYDSNRAIDGLDLRKKFILHVSHDDVFLRQFDNWPCSVLEMLIALAYRAEDDFIYDPRPGDNAVELFWRIIHNLGLSDYDDNYYYENRVNDILNNFMHHKYDADGRHGGAFPCPGVVRDMRKTDLWWQIGAYFQQNYSLKIS